MLENSPLIKSFKIIIMLGSTLYAEDNIDQDIVNIPLGNISTGIYLIIAKDSESNNYVGKLIVQ